MENFINRLMFSSYFRKYREIFVLLFDVMTVLISFTFSCFVRYDFDVNSIEYTNMQDKYWIVMLELFIFGICFHLFRVNKSLWKYTGISEVLRITLANAAAVSIIFIGRTCFHYPLAFGALVNVFVYNVLLMVCLRVLYRLYRRHVVMRQEKEKVFIIGAGDAGVMMLRELTQNINAKYRCIGFLDDFKVNKIVSGIRVLGTTNDLKNLIDEYRVKRVVITMPSAPKEKIRQVFEDCQKLNLKVKIMRELNDTLEDSLHRKTLMQDVNIEDLLGRGEIHLDQQEITSYIEHHVVCVTGAGGSIGSELARQLVKYHPKTLILIDINENGLYMLEQEFQRAKRHGKISNEINIISYIASIRDKKALYEIFKQHQPQVVYHAAAHKHVPLMEERPMEAIKNNVFGTHNLIQCCIDHKVERFIMISTDKAVNPTNVMGATKRMTEMLLQSYGNNGVTKMAAVRFGNVLGSNGSVIPIFKEQIATGGPVTITSKEIIRYFMTIPEAARLVLQAGYYANQGEVFVLDMGKPVKILELAEKMIRLSGYEPYTDIDIVEIGLRPGEKMFEELRLDSETTTKTKNNLIYKNEVMRITKDEILEKLLILQKKLEENASKEELRNTLLSMIKDKSIG